MLLIFGSIKWYRKQCSSPLIIMIISHYYCYYTYLYLLNYRKLPQVPANANTAVGGGPIGGPTLTTSVTKTRPSIVRPSKSFNLPFGFGQRGSSTAQSQTPGGGLPSTAGSRMNTSRGAKLPVVPGSHMQQNNAATNGGGGFFGSIGMYK